MHSNSGCTGVLCVYERERQWKSEKKREHSSQTAVCIPSVGELDGLNLINSVCRGRGLVLSAGGNVMSQWIRLMGWPSSVACWGRYIQQSAKLSLDQFRGAVQSFCLFITMKNRLCLRPYLLSSEDTKKFLSFSAYCCILRKKTKNELLTFGVWPYILKTTTVQTTVDSQRGSCMNGGKL